MATIGKYTIYVSGITAPMIESERQIIIHSEMYGKSESDKCKESPYYFYTNYFMANGRPATTGLSEEEFNRQFFEETKNNGHD